MRTRGAFDTNDRPFPERQLRSAKSAAQRTGRPVVDPAGRVYASISEAARTYRLTKPAIRYRARLGIGGWRFAEPSAPPHHGSSLVTETAPAESLLLRHLRSLVGRAVTLHRDEEDSPIGRLIEVDAGHALLEFGNGTLSLVPLDGLKRVESGPREEAGFAHRRRLHELYGERMTRAEREMNERDLRRKLERVESDQPASPSIADPDAFLRALANADGENRA